MSILDIYMARVDRPVIGQCPVGRLALPNPYPKTIR
jgi:hypothetical protein